MFMPDPSWQHLTAPDHTCNSEYTPAGLLRYSYVLEYLSKVTLFPAEPGLPKDPELVVVKVDFSSWWQEGVSQLTIQPVETRVEGWPPAVSVVKGVEA